MLTRRGFLKISGAMVLSSAVPVMGESDTPSVVLSGLQAGSHIWVGEAATGEEIFQGIAENDTVGFDYVGDTPTEVIIRIRKTDFRAMEFRIGGWDNIEIPIVQQVDNRHQALYHDLT